MKHLPLILLALLFWTATTLSAATYYVDNEKGNDQNKGTSPETAWKSIKQVNQAKLLPGDSVLFRCGGFWRGNVLCQSGAVEKPVTYASYGKGPRPVITGSVPLDKISDWNKVPDLDNIWVTNKATLGKEKIVSAPFTKINWHSYCDDDGKIDFKILADQSGKKMPKEYQLTCLNSGQRSTNIQFTLAPFEVFSDKALVLRFKAKATVPFTIKSVSLMRKIAPWGSLGNCQTPKTDITTDWKEFEITFFTHKSEKDGRLSFFIGKDLPKGCVFSFVPLDAYFVDVHSNGINIDVGNMILIEKGKDQKFAGFKRWSVKELKEQADYYYDPETSLVYFRSDINPAEKYQMAEAALKCHIFSSNAHIVIDGFTMINGAAHGVGGGGIKANDIVIRNCDISWIGGGHLYTRNGQCTRYGNGIEFYGGGRNCLVENNTFSEVYDVAMTIQGRGEVVNENIIWRNNVVHHCEQAYEIWFSEKNSVIRNVIFENNTCVDAGICWGHRQRPDKRGTHLLGYGLKTNKIDHIIRNNVFANTNQNLIWYYNGRIGEFDIDNNVWWDDSMNTHSEKEQKLFAWDVNKNQVSFKEYQKRTGNDKNSKTVKPIFADPDHFDYRIVNKDEIGNAGAQR